MMDEEKIRQALELIEFVGLLSSHPRMKGREEEEMDHCHVWACEAERLIREALNERM